MEVYFKFILTFGLILIAARIAGEFSERYLKQPPVLGEILAGILISPFAFGGLLFKGDPIILNFATVKHITFEPVKSGIFGYLAGNPIKVEEFHCMEIISEIAVITLLFVAGLETDIRAFLKYGLTGVAVAFGGVILPFIFGFFSTKILFPQVGVPGWLFMGAVLTATSIGITVRILMDMKRLNTKEGITILVGAVVDDIIGIVILSAVLMVTSAGVKSFSLSKGIQLWQILCLFIMGFGIWFSLLMVGSYFHRYISKLLLAPFRNSGTMPIFALIFGFLISYLVTFVKLHPVVGAYVAGLMFAATEEKENLIENTRPIMLFLAPFFFTYLGMQVDLSKITTPIVASLTIILIILATLGKVIGCAIPAWLIGKLRFNESIIVGIGMVPRGEVGLIIAAVGFLAGAISRELFGAAVIVSVITTLITPLMLKPCFKRVNNSS